MIVISKEEKERFLNGKTMVILELRGLSTDEKPSDKIKEKNIDNGSVFIEIDTGDVYLFDLEGETWNNVTTPSSEESQDNEEQNNDEQNNEEPTENVGE